MTYDPNTVRQLALEAWNGDHESFLVLQDAVEEQDPKLAKKLRSDKPMKIIGTVATLIGWKVKYRNKNYCLDVDQGNRVIFMHFPLVNRLSVSMTSDITNDDVSFDSADGVYEFLMEGFEVSVDDPPPPRFIRASNITNGEIIDFELDAPLKDVSEVTVSSFESSEIPPNFFVPKTEAHLVAAREIQDTYKSVSSEVDVFLGNLRRGLGLKF